MSESAGERAMKALIRVGQILQLGLFFKSRHARDFSNAEDIADGATDALVPVHEFEDHDESQLFHDVMMSFAGDCLKHEKGAGHAAHFEDQHWGYTKGLVEGTLRVTDPTVLPEACRVGVFAKPDTYAVVSRPNFLHDGDRIRVSRLSLKLQTPFDVPNVYTLEGRARELDLLLSEGVRQGETNDQDGQGFFFRDARQLRYLSWMQNHKAWAALTLLNSANCAVLLAQQQVMTDALDTLYKPEHARKSWDEKDYYSAGPYALGGFLVKFALRTRQDSQAASRTPGPDGPARDQGAWFSAWQSGDVPAVFDLCVQVARYGAIRKPDGVVGAPCKAVMASEFTDLVWDETVSPFVPVGTLTLQPGAAPKDPDPWYFQSRDRWYGPEETPPHALRFNAWNTLPDMHPVGQLFRARKRVHALHRETRMRHTSDGTPNLSAMCPVAGVKPPKGAK
ncbi:MAG: hypothetical protein AB3N11_06750 [Arenibacterium sp.]